MSETAMQNTGEVGPLSVVGNVPPFQDVFEGGKLSLTVLLEVLELLAVVVGAVIADRIGDNGGAHVVSIGISSRLPDTTMRRHSGQHDPVHAQIRQAKMQVGGKPSTVAGFFYSSGLRSVKTGDNLGAFVTVKQVSFAGFEHA